MSLRPLVYDQATDTQTAWGDLWIAVSETLRTPAVASRLREARDQAIGRKITEEINADPAEVARLRRARRNARAGKTYPRHSDTK